MTINPFAKSEDPPASTESTSDNPPTTETKSIEPPLIQNEEAFEQPKEETPLEIVTHILAQYDNKESDIPLNCYEYWSAKRRL